MLRSACYLASSFCVALSLVACGDGDDMPGPNSTGTGALPPTAGTGAIPGPLETTTTLFITNTSNDTLTGVFLSSSTSRKWGSNQLAGVQLDSGESYSILEIPCGGYYDLMVTGNAGYVIDEQYNQYFSCGVPTLLTVY